MPARILLIEDNPDNLDLMTYLLMAFGYTAFAATDGAAGLAAVRRESPDLIICDVQLPVLDGLEVARRLKSDPLLRTIPLVAVTALAMVGDRDRVLATGFDGYIAKPINPETFVRQMEAFLPPDRHAAGPPPSAAPGTSATPQPAAHHALLVVDNLQVNLDLARSIFAPHGFEVITADGMAQGLALAREHPFDLILSDVCMAEGSGYDFIQAVKADPRLRAIPFVFITSTMLEEKDRAKGLALGAARFLMRPIDPLALLAEIEACLREKSSL
jgi:two-component system cell cycle response regulator